MLAMTLLGVGTGVPDRDRENTHMIWESPEGLLLIDAGGSTYQRILRAGLDPAQLYGIVLTHSHADHLNGLPGLLFSLRLSGFQQRLTIYGNAPTLALAQRILNAFELESYNAATDWVVVEAGDQLPLATPSFRVRTALTQHSRPCLALRFEAAATGLALTYSADTEPCPAVADLAAGSQILIHEATTPDPFPGHTSPTQAGAIAHQARVAQLVLVHFSPHWTMPIDQAIAAVHAAGFTGHAEVGQEFGRYLLEA
jgi:ribonuclease Z